MLVRRGDGVLQDTAQSLAYVNHGKYWFQIEQKDAKTRINVYK